MAEKERERDRDRRRRRRSGSPREKEKKQPKQARAAAAAAAADDFDWEAERAKLERWEKTGEVASLTHLSGFTKKKGWVSPAEAAAAQAKMGAAAPDLAPAMLTVDVIRVRMQALYMKHRPAQAIRVDALLAKYPGKELDILKRTCVIFNENPNVAHELVDGQKPAPAMWANTTRAKPLKDRLQVPAGGFSMNMPPAYEHPYAQLESENNSQDGWGWGAAR